MTVTARYLNHIKPQLSDRDLSIIEDIGRFKLLTGGQVERLYFAHGSQKSRARNRQAVLKRLKDHGVIAHVGERRIGGAKRGSASHLYALDIAGQHIAQTHSRQPRRKYSWYEPTIAHFLAVAELYVVLKEAEQSGRLVVLSFDPEPYSWRTYGQGRLEPDAFARIGVAGPDGRGYQRSVFIEVDRANQRGIKIATKFPQYLNYYNHEQLQGPPRAFPRIVFLAPDERRVTYLQGLVDERPDTRHLFRVGLLDDPLAVLLAR
ncbi:replication-relaxation family protein [Streptomyces sp. NPDC127079]|uniref:Replication-relaxation family protein n=1 Tax=Streptomyces sp. R39 TaxID=3238631 RepID=A0AB39QIB9_9ACTN